MKKTLLLFVFILTIGSYSQYPEVPWLQQQDGKYAKPMNFNYIMKRLEQFKESVDMSKKGNGIKPFERWRSLWEPYFYRKGGFHPVQDIDNAFAKKQQLAAKRADLQSNWTSLGPTVIDRNNRLPGKGRVNFVLIDPTDSNIMYIGAPAGGIWKTTDKGQTWTPLADHLPQIGVSAIALSHQDHNKIFIGTGDDDAKDTYTRGVFRSTDGGVTWNHLGPGQLNDTDVIYEIIVNPENDDVLWVATSNGLYKTTDGGVNWTRTLQGNIKSMKKHPVSHSILYAATNSQFYRSTDGGDTFSSVNVNFGNVPLRIEVETTPAAPDKVYLAAVKNDGGFGGVYVSNDQGQTFSRTAETDNFFANNNQSWYDFAFAVSDTDPNLLFIGVINLSRSTDGGDNIANINRWDFYTPNYTHADIHFLRYYNGVLACGSDGGIYLSEDNGESFTDYNEGLAISQLYKISTSLTNNYQIYGGLQDNGGFSRKDLKWRIYHGGDGMENAMNNNEPNVGYSFIYYGQQLNITTDGGITVNSGADQPAGEKGNWVTPLDMGADGVLYSGFKKLYKLENGVWQAVTNTAFTGNIDVLECDPLNPDIIYVAEGSKIYKSTNKGVSFTEIGSSFQSITSITVNPFDNKVWFTTDNWIYESSDNGSNWTVITGNYPGEHINVIKWHPFSTDNTLYLGSDLGVYYKNDSSADWQVFSTNLPNVPVRDLEVNFEQGILTAGTFGRGVWETNVPVTKPENDLAVIDIASATGHPYLCEETNGFIAKIKNKGNNAINGFQLKYLINGTSSTIDYNQAVQAGEVVEIELPQQNWELKKYEVNAEVLVDNESFIQNNVYKNFFLFDINANLNFETSFESIFTDKLLHYREVGTDVWEMAQPSGFTLKNTGSGTKAYCTNAGGNYDDLSKDYLLTPCFDMTQVINPAISFKLAFDIEENWDAFYVQYSTDYGQTWEILGTADDPNWYNSDFEQSECLGRQWTGTNPDMLLYSHDLSFLANETHVMFRFVMASDPSVNQEGVVLDDLKITGTAGVIDERISNAIMLYPNPAKNTIHLKWDDEVNVSGIEIMSLDGKQLTISRPENVSQYIIDISHLPTGMYLVKISTDKGSGMKKLIVN